MLKYLLLFFFSCKNSSESTTSSSSSTVDNNFVYSSFIEEDGDVITDGNPCLFNNLKVTLKLHFPKGLLNIIPEGLMEKTDNTNPFFSCTNCNSLEVLKIDETEYHLLIEPENDEYGDVIGFEVKPVFKKNDKTTYKIPPKNTCIITNKYTSPIIEEATNLQEMILDDFLEINTPSSVSLEMPPVQNQKGGSCIAFASNNAFSYTLWKSLGKPRDLATQKPDYSNAAVSPYFAYVDLRSNSSTPSCSDTVHFDDVFELFKTKGSALFSTIPKGDLDSQCMYPLTPSHYSDALNNKAWTVMKLKLEDTTLEEFTKILKGALTLEYPLIFSVLVSKNFYNIKENAPLWNTQDDKIKDLGHAMVLSGYIDNYQNSGETVFKMFNSWGKPFGIDGEGLITAKDLKDKIVSVMIVLAKDKILSNLNPVAEYNFDNNLLSETNQHNGLGFLSYSIDSNKTVASFNAQSKVSLGGVFDFTKGYSASLWIKPTNILNEQIIISQVLPVVNNTVGFEVRIKNGAIFTKSIDQNTIETSGLSLTLLQPSSWNHIVLTWDTSMLKTYLNNQLISIKPLWNTINYVVNSQPIFLGTSSISNTQKLYIGTMANVKIYEGTVLKPVITSVEVKSLFDQGF